MLANVSFKAQHLLTSWGFGIASCQGQFQHQYQRQCPLKFPSIDMPEATFNEWYSRARMGTSICKKVLHTVLAMVRFRALPMAGVLLSP